MDIAAIATNADKPSYADTVATPRVAHVDKPRALPPAAPLPVPNKPRLKATVKGTRSTRIYSRVPASAHTRLLSMRHNHGALYPRVLSAAAKLLLAASLLGGNPITRVFWSANGQFIIVQFKDDVSDDIYRLFTDIFMALLSITNILCVKTPPRLLSGRLVRRLIIWATLYRLSTTSTSSRTLLASKTSKFSACQSSYLPSIAMVLSKFIMVAALIAR